jgi:hypothetical protein
MPNNLEKNNSNSDNDDEHETESESESESDSESNNTTLNGEDDISDDEIFVRFDSTSNHDNVDYAMIGSTCYVLSDGIDNQSEQNSEDDENANENACTGCHHDVLIYFINGYVEQQMMEKNEIKDLCLLQGINISSVDTFFHLLDLE